MVRPGGRIAITDPEAPDPVFNVARFIDDETTVYIDTRNAIAALVDSGRITRAIPLLYAAKNHVSDAQEMLDKMIVFDSDFSFASIAPRLSTPRHF